MVEDLELKLVSIGQSNLQNGDQQDLQIDPDDASLEILVTLAREGELDPWNIDLEKITTKYLQAISDNPIENLKEAGRAIFYASVLLRMKSDVLLAQSNEARNIGIHRELDDNYLLEEELNSTQVKQISFDDLESAIRRRFIQKAKRFRKLTLQDLISALKDAQEEEERRIARKQQKLFDIDAYSIVAPEVSDDILELTHAENLEAAIERLAALLPEYLVDGQGLEFNDIVKLIGDWSNAFLALTFLAHENKIRFEQKDFYGELWIYEPTTN